MGLYVFSQDEKFKQAIPRLITQDENAVKVIGGGGGAYSYGILKKTGEVELWFAGKLLRPKFDAPVVDFSTTPGNSYFLLNTGRVYALGGNSNGQLAQRAKMSLQKPLRVEKLNRIIKIDNFTALDDKGRVWQWGGIAGINLDKTFSGNNMYSQYFPRVMMSGKDIVDIYCCSFALAKDGTVWAWSNDTGGRRGDAGS